MRLFIAVELPGIVKEELSGLQKSYPNIKASWMVPENMHLTLQFLGEIEDKESIIQALKTVKQKKIEAMTGNLGYFKDRRGPRVLWVSLEPEMELKALAKKVSDAIKIKPDKDFASHITIARIREVQGQLGLNRPQPMSFIVDHFSLIKSTLKPEGPEYEVLEDFELTL
jgi:2'-5' RNA ligase